MVRQAVVVGLVIMEHLEDKTKEIDMETQGITPGDGWTCFTCGAYVSWNQSHQCFGNPYIPNPPYQHIPQYTVHYDNTKIDELIELIKVLIEKLDK